MMPAEANDVQGMAGQGSTFVDGLFIPRPRWLMLRHVAWGNTSRDHHPRTAHRRSMTAGLAGAQ